MEYSKCVLYSNPMLLGETRNEFLGTVSANGVTEKKKMLAHLLWHKCIIGDI